MSRGGKREGAGRPSTISPLLEFQILEDCRRLAWQKRLEQAGERANKAAGVSWQEEGEADPLDLPQRHRAIVSYYGSLHPDEKIPGDAPEEVRYAIEIIRDNKRKLEGKPRLYSMPLPGLYRAREAIIKQVAKDRGVSRRMVRSIWDAKPDV
ncbi:hypothetical protein [Bradyrhizobium sp. 195]|uniref:hypothetical protein n=1 Tax=Bradyrhizobium sp. 195 TaxID=2782662 RepID=UPI00200107DE|nr:hypothetical protein [Bradyrhizobium sp. 195]UPK23870.1 hypothetical protein IVB26_20955 [Bradyrhizobium sp. 195]